jgi:hypothetical protein
MGLMAECEEESAARAGGGLAGEVDQPAWLRGLREMAQYNSKRTRVRMGMAVIPGAVAALAALLLVVAALTGTLLRYGGAGFGLLILAVVLGAGMAWLHGGAERARASDIRRLASGADARAIGPLACMARSNVLAGSYLALPTLQAVIGALTDMLSGVTADDAPLVDEGDRAELRAVLCLCVHRYGPLRSRVLPPEFVAAALHALTAVEDAPALRVAERLSRARGTGRAARDMRAAAAAALPDLQAMAARARDRAQLLRPTAPPSDPSLLVRPASGGADGERERLLRPFHGPDDAG